MYLMEKYSPVPKEWLENLKIWLVSQPLPQKLTDFNIGLEARKPYFVACKQRKQRSACTVYLSLCYLLSDRLTHIHYVIYCLVKMILVRLEPVASRSRVKHSTNEPLRYHIVLNVSECAINVGHWVYEINTTILWATACGFQQYGILTRIENPVSMYSLLLRLETPNDFQIVAELS